MLLWPCTALALTPTELADAAETAQEQLQRCEATGCGPEVGARAAFLVAVSHYQQEGVADGRLAATVRYLDPALFEDLPDVLQDAATSPWPWATRTLGPRERMPRSLFDTGTPFACPPSTSRASRFGMPVTIAITDATSDRPVRFASVTFPGEDRHLAHGEEGTWTGSVLYPKDRVEEVLFTPGCELTFEVAAPGYRPVTLSTTLSKRRKEQIDVALEPFEVLSDGSPEGDAALRAFTAWDARITDYLERPSAQSFDAVDLARLEAAIAARAWMDAGGSSDARDLCLSTGTRAYCSEASDH